MRKNLLFGLFAFLLIAGCSENSGPDEKTLQLLTEIKTQQSALLQQVGENTEMLRKLEDQNQKLRRLVEHQRALLNRRSGMRRSTSNSRHVSRMIEAMSRTHPPSKVAEMLNRKKVPNPGGGTWTAQDVQSVVAEKRPSGKSAPEKMGKDKSHPPGKSEEPVTKEE